MAMKTIKEIKEILERNRKKLEKEYNIKSIKIFGSYAEGKQKEKSDIDLIVDFKKTPTFIELIKIEEEISKLLDTKVDLLTEEGISPYIKPYIKEVNIL
jgi:predicted nucleotidyltransferase